MLQITKESWQYQDLVNIQNNLIRAIEFYSVDSNLPYFQYEAEIKKKKKLNTLKAYLYNSLLGDDLRYEYKIRFLNEIPGFDTLKGAKQVLFDYLAPFKIKDTERRDKITIPSLKKELLAVTKMLEVIDTENLKVSKSPCSESYYAFEDGEEITWGYKPQNSYRFSDHWNFESDNKIHCVTDDTIKSNETCLAIYKNGKYSKVA